MARYLITGIAGFIGSSLATALVERGDEVRGVDNLSTGKRCNLRNLMGCIDFREADLRDAGAMRDACEGMEFVLHHGAFVSVPLSIEQPELSHRCNVDGTLNILEAARATGVRRLIYAGSSSVYGNQALPVADETMLPCPISPYGAQKLAAEYYARTYWQAYGLETVSLRYFNVFGPRQSSDSPYSGVIARFIEQMLDGKQPIIFGSGEQARDFTYVDNVVRANLLACHAPAEKVAGKVFNIACGCPHNLNRLYEMLAGLIGYKEPPRHAPPRPGDIVHSEADISVATQGLEYRPDVSFEEGLRRTVQWFRESLASDSLQESGSRSDASPASPLAPAQPPPPLYDAPALVVPSAP
jgi:nucleoside-diphosphate-sugar epimerase